MPASSFDLYPMHNARKNLDAMRPASICTDTHQISTQSQNIHISTNCYYGYDLKKNHNLPNANDCEMVEIPPYPNGATTQSNARKRSAKDSEYPQSKRLREEVQRNKNIEPETKENTRSDKSAEDLLESLYWNIHGGNIFHLQCS